MCGIIGVASTGPVTEGAWLRRGQEAMCHRGPDGAGEWWSPDRRVGFGHRRLAIIDLSEGGNQPMHTTDGVVSIVFNGEIYNFQELRAELHQEGYPFRSQCDTEVILAAYVHWGDHFLARLSGMFAFALFDSRRGEIVLARDRAGEKPLFYSFSGETLRFASETKGLMSSPGLSRRIDRAALDCYLAMGYAPGDMCLIKEVRKLPPAHALRFNLRTGAFNVSRYWRLPPVEVEHGLGVPREILLDRLEVLLADAVRRQLVSDVPVGILLSGGVDSSLVTAMAARAAPRVKTFTVSFPGHARYDETEHARLIARYFNTEHIELRAQEATPDLLFVLARQFDEPVVDSSMIPTYLVSRLIREHCTVALGGDGGDELFGGYHYYSHLLWVRQNLGWMPHMAGKLAGATARRLLPVGFRGRNWLLAMSVDLKKEIPNFASHFDRHARQHLLGEQGRPPLIAEQVRESRSRYLGDLLQRATRLDFENYLPEDVLVKVDRASMLTSLEVRAPLLDHRLIEFAYRDVPSYLKATSSSRKILLKDLTSRVLPLAFDRERKQGFSIPLATWLRTGPWRTFVEEVLFDSGATLFDRRFVRKLFDGHIKGLANGERLFALTLLELWRREYRMNL